MLHSLSSVLSRMWFVGFFPRFFFRFSENFVFLLCISECVCLTTRRCGLCGTLTNGARRFGASAPHREPSFVDPYFKHARQQSTIRVVGGSAHARVPRNNVRCRHFRCCRHRRCRRRYVAVYVHYVCAPGCMCLRFGFPGYKIAIVC